jgi:uncharacterized protein (DUF58 family)
VNQTARLTAEAARAASALPPLLAEAERAAASVFGVHGRRRAGSGETFWQYRQAQPGDSMQSIDWRRSGRSDEVFVRETEWETAQTVWLWPDDAASMRFQSKKAPTQKSDRATLLALSLAILLERGGERFAFLGRNDRAIRSGRTGVNRAALLLSRECAPDGDYGFPPNEVSYTGGSRVVFMSDFFGDLEKLKVAMSEATSRRAKGVLLQIVDPAEEAFPYKGRVLFESISGALKYDADRAESLHDAYRSRLAERRDTLKLMARKSGWRFAVHRTDQPISPTLMMLHQTLENARAGR